MSREIHVMKTGRDSNSGAANVPLETIAAAAAVAQPGDTITVHEGVYREEIDPPRGGTSDVVRIVYQAAPGENVVIKGSEVVGNWQHVEANTWMAVLPNAMFGVYNPYDSPLKGAWYEAHRPYHTGAVYLDGHWLHEATRKSEVLPSEGDREATDGPAELMNIESINMPDRGWVGAEAFVLASEGVGAIELPEGKKGVGRMTDGAYLAYEMEFGADSRTLQVSAASPLSGGIIDVRLGAVDGDLIGQVDVGFTAEWHHFQVYHGNIEPRPGKHTVYLVFSARPELTRDSATDLGSWFAEVGNESTRIWADFKGRDPNTACVEVNVRRSVIYPRKPGINYVTVRGFTLEQAAAPWVAPTAEQVALIGTHWSKGWVIANNTIRYSTCVGVTLGKYGDEHDHTYDYRGKSIALAVENGWSRENIGHHVVEGNHIYNCGQGGIQGSLGCSFSTIRRNEIHDIKKHHQYGGCETAGIKLHGAVDVLIADNHVYNCEHWGGIWLDWMGQGARITGNLLHDNSQDLMLEVNHGPHLVDHNVLLSKQSVTEASGGGAFVHNLWSGNINIWPKLEVRKTPYFKPHSVEIVDSTDVNQDDERFFNNLFVDGSGTAAYDEHGIAITAAGNAFLGAARPSQCDSNAVTQEMSPVFELKKLDDGWWIESDGAPLWGTSEQRALVTSERLGRAEVPDARFENRDGAPYHLDTDYFGSECSLDNPAPGPFGGGEGAAWRVKVWPKH